MKLTSLLENLKYEILQGTTDKSVTSLVYFSEDAVEESVFFAIAGAQRDGREFCEDAIRLGSNTVVVQEPWSYRDPTVTVILVEDARRAMAEMSKVFYGNPFERMLTIGITGTKGKTSTTFFLRSILETAGIKTGIAGTVINGCEGNFVEASHTTPQSIDLYRLASEMVAKGCKAMVLEVSSQGLMHRRVEGIFFDVAVFTNLSPDHIGPGEHESFEDYAYWKSRLFLQCKKAIYRKEDPYWERLYQNVCEEKGVLDFDQPITFGKSSDADYFVHHIVSEKKHGKTRVRFRVGMRRYSLFIGGQFNALNGAAALAVAHYLGIKWKYIKKGLWNARIPGRLEPIETGTGCTVLVDYAHNGIALETILKDLKRNQKGRLIVVFGCGGNRDRNRRFEMGRVAGRLADYSVITSDNPRRESPEQIIKDITSSMDEVGVEKENYIVIEDRRSAIGHALQIADEQDTVLIAGKGHETYQLIGDCKLHFDDREVVRDFVASMDGTKRRGNREKRKMR